MSVKVTVVVQKEENWYVANWYGMQPMSQQAAAATHPGHQVIAAIRGNMRADDVLTLDAITVLLSSHKVFSSIDMIHVLGNHEYMGDDGSKEVAIFGNPKNGPSVNPAG